MTALELILHLIHGPATSQEVAAASGHDLEHVEAHLEMFRKMGTVARCGGKWCLPGDVE